MTRADAGQIRFWGRPFKPLAVGLITASVTLAVNQFVVICGKEPLIVTPSGAVGLIGFASMAAVLGMFVSWLGNWQRLYQWSLLLCMGAWVARSMSLALDTQYVPSMLPFSFALMAGGAYVLETLDERVDWEIGGR